VFNILLQVLDDGRLTDNKGRIANFKNTIIIMTSNLGSDIIARNFDGAVEAELDRISDKTDMEMKEMLRHTLKPEFLNRIDETIIFRPLMKKDVKAIVRINLNTLTKHLKEQDIRLTATEEVVEHLAEMGFDPQFGARPIKRMIQKNVLNELSKQLLAGKVKRGQDLVLDIFDGQFAFRKPITEEEMLMEG
jgi:ATP-dependent Clp protease ATP-binding subunit ClpB